MYLVHFSIVSEYTKNSDVLKGGLSINFKELIYLMIICIVMHIILVLVFSLTENELILWNQYFIGHYMGILFALAVYLFTKSIKKGPHRSR